jgi:hypothetical protein
MEAIKKLIQDAQDAAESQNQADVDQKLRQFKDEH